MKKSLIFTVALTLATLSGCGGMQADSYYDIPAGHVGKVLTPKGWQEGVIEAGQVNLGGQDMDNRRNSVVFLESSAVQVKEQFGQNKGVDNRIITAGRDGVGQIPLVVDVYLRMRVPADEKLRNRVFAEITPKRIGDSERTSLITIQSVYSRYAMQEARSLIRQIIGSYADDLDINAKRSEIELRLQTELIARLKQLKVPLELQSASLSNVAPDVQIQRARNQSSAAIVEAEAIDKIGQAINRNPGYVELQRIKAVENIGTAAAEAGKPPTLIFGVSGDAHPYAARASGN